jgi:hypothetical protein
VRRADALALRAVLFRRLPGQIYLLSACRAFCRLAATEDIDAWAGGRGSLGVHLDEEADGLLAFGAARDDLTGALAAADGRSVQEKPVRRSHRRGRRWRSFQEVDALLARGWRRSAIPAHARLAMTINVGPRNRRVEPGVECV